MFIKPYWQKLDKAGKLLFGALIIAVLMKIITILTLTINWDEFYNLNLTYKYTRGEITNPYQTILLRVFSWLPHLPISDISQIVVARFVMFIPACLTCLFIYKTARRFASVNASLFSVLSYVSFYFVTLHLTSFRVDGIVTALLMAVIWLVSDPNQSWGKTVISGILIGLAGLFSFKSIFYMPIIATFLISKWAVTGWSKREFFNGITMFVVAISSYALAFHFHGQNIVYSASGESYFFRILEHSFLGKPFLIQLLFMLSSVIFNPVLWAFLIFGLWSLLSGFRKRNATDRAQAINLISLTFPVSTLLYYEQLAPYYYLFVLAPAAIIVAVGADQYLSKPRKLPFTVLVLSSISILIISFGYSTVHGQKYQRQVQSNIHTIFPKSETYLDYCGMVPSFDRILEPGIFINPEIDNGERMVGAPFMENLIRKRQPKFFLSNISALDIDNLFKHSLHFKLLPEDETVLRQNFVHYWGPVYIAGKKFENVREDSSIEFEIIIEGKYTLRGSSPLRIDGQLVEPNTTVFLSSGMHLADDILAQNMQLIWGEDLVLPPEIEKPERIFWTF